MKTRLLSFFAIAIFSMALFSADAIAGERNIYQLKVYTIENQTQEQLVDAFLEKAYLPALHRAGIKHVGVFKPLAESEDAGAKIYVMIPFENIDQFEGLEAVLAKDSKFQKAGADYIMASPDTPPYVRIESVLLRAFTSMPAYGVPELETPASERIYELRSYQGPTEERYEKKVAMFDNGEAKLFMDLGFQPVFFGEVISGPDMPNLMYLTTHANKEAQDKNWDAFRNSPVWDKLKNDPQYANTVSHIDKYLLYPTDYSDL